MASADVQSALEDGFQWEDAITSSCTSCGFQILPGTGITVKHCDSVLCCICIREAIEEAKRRGTQEVRCPMVDAGTICNRPLDEKEVETALLLNSNLSSAMDTDETMSKDCILLASPTEEEPLSLSNVQIILNTEDDKCRKCSTDTPGGVGILLQACRHNFCKACLRSVINASDGAGVKCPLECGQSMFEREIRMIATPNDYADYNTRSYLAATKNLSEHQCQLNGCNGICEIPINGSSISKCLVCSHSQCVNCAGVLIQLKRERDENEQERALLVHHYETQLESSQKELESQHALINQLLEQMLAQNIYADEIQAWKEDFEKSGTGQETGGAGPSRNQPVHIRLYDKFKDMDPVTQGLIVVGVGISAVFIGASSFTFISWAWPALETFAARMATSQSLEIITLFVNSRTFIAVIDALKEGKPLNAELFKSLGADILSLISQMAPLFLKTKKLTLR